MAQEKSAPPIVSVEVYRPVIRLVIALIVLGVISAILTSLPMLRELVVPALIPFTITAFISVVFGLLMIGVLFRFKREITPIVQGRWPAFPQMGTIVGSAVLLIAILIASDAFKAVTFQALVLAGAPGLLWAYDLGFLGLAILPAYILGMALYRNVDRLSGIVAGKVATATGEFVQCAKCGEATPRTQKFCGKCGSPLGAPPPASASPILSCKKCGHKNEPSTKFCGNCGGALE